MDLPALATATHRHLRRFDLTPRETLLAVWLVDLTFGVGRTAVRIATLQSLEDLTGISRGDISRALRTLQKSKILSVVDSPEGMLYQVHPDANFWQARPRRTEAEQVNALAAIASLNRIEQIELIKSDKSLLSAMFDASLEAALNPVVNLTTEPLSNHQRPDRCQFDNAHATRSESTPKGAVVNLTTPHLRALRVQQLKSSKLLNCEDTEEGGTGGGSASSPPEADPTVESIWLQRCRELFGEASMLNWGGLWRKRARANPAKLERVLAAVDVDLREGKPIKNPGGYAHDLWRRFHD